MLTSNSRARRAFTLVELLVVIGVIAVLIAMLLPSLQKARTQAGDVRCAAAMRQTLIAVTMYNNQYKQGLQNYYYNCQYWGQGWPGGATPAATSIHWNEPNDKTGTAFYHAGNEGRSGASYWRGYLIDAHILGRRDKTGVVINSDGLGCPFTDYTDDNTVNWGSNGSFSSLWGANHVEPASNQASLKRNPSFVWLGPGASRTQQVNFYTGSNVQLTGDPYVENGVNFYHRGRKPLLTCPKVFRYGTIGIASTKKWEPTHRRLWAEGDIVSTQGGYAENVGFSDGSVQFFARRLGGTFDPMQ